MIHTFGDPDRVVIDGVGPTGDRSFFLQACQGPRLITVRMERDSVKVLAERVTQLLDQVSSMGQDERIPPTTDSCSDHDPLRPPSDPDFTVAAMGLGWSAATAQLILECHAMADSGLTIPDLGSDDDGPDTLRVFLSADAAREFAARALFVLAAGRPDCPFCGLPLDPSGHVCPRANGQRRR